MPLHFKDGAAAVEYASKYMVCKLAAGVELPAIVLDAREEFGTAEAVRTAENGIQTAVLRVCGDNGGFIALSQTSGPIGPTLAPGEMVLWRAVKYLGKMGRAAPDRRTGWIGLIAGTLSPTLIAEGWIGKDRFSA
jgi:hypothetical protein